MGGRRRSALLLEPGNRRNEVDFGAGGGLAAGTFRGTAWLGTFVFESSRPEPGLEAAFRWGPAENGVAKAKMLDIGGAVV